MTDDELRRVYLEQQELILRQQLRELWLTVALITRMNPAETQRQLFFLRQKAGQRRYTPVFVESLHDRANLLLLERLMFLVEELGPLSMRHQTYDAPEVGTGGDHAA